MLKWVDHPCLRLELLGCQQCRTLVGYPPFGRMSASSELGPVARERVRRSTAGARAEQLSDPSRQQVFQRPRGPLMFDAMSCSADDGSILSNRAWCPATDNGAATFGTSKITTTGPENHIVERVDGCCVQRTSTCSSTWARRRASPVW